MNQKKEKKEMGTYTLAFANETIASSSNPVVVIGSFEPNQKKGSRYISKSPNIDIRKFL